MAKINKPGFIMPLQPQAWPVGTLAACEECGAEWEVEDQDKVKTGSRIIHNLGRVSLLLQCPHCGDFVRHTSAPQLDALADAGRL